MHLLAYLGVRNREGRDEILRSGIGRWTALLVDGRNDPGASENLMLLV